MNCKNCNAHNPAGASHCQRCHIPGDFGLAPVAEAKVLAPALKDCGNCGAHAPATAALCPSCRWPLPAQIQHNHTLTHQSLRHAS